MDLNSVELPAFAIANLYPNSLVDIANEKMEKELPEEPQLPEQKEEWKYLGENRKQVAIIVEFPDFVYIQDDDLAFLTAMLGACKLSMADVALVNRSSHKEIGYKELATALHPNVVFLFGVNPPALGLPVDFPQFQVQTFSGVTYLYSAPLADVRNDDLLKSKLWVCLRRIFGI
jgi:hypothetical protein